MLFDTSVWIEYFKGTELGEKIKKIFNEPIVICSCPITFAEISNWAYKNKEEPTRYIQKVKTLSRIIELSEDILVKSGKIYYDLTLKN